MHMHSSWMVLVYFLEFINIYIHICNLTCTFILACPSDCRLLWSAASLEPVCESFCFFDRGWYTYDVQENCPIFKTPDLLVHLNLNTFHPLDLGRPISDEPQPPPLSSNDNQSIKRERNPKMTIICYQVLPSGRLSFSVSTHESCLAFLWLLFI